MYLCDSCNKLTIASKKYTVKNCSKHLIVYLKRFNNINKNNIPIEIPLKWKYDTTLQGAIIHYGSLNGGHYVYIGKYNNKWYLFNDNMVSSINEHQLTSILNNAYCLYYSK